MIRPKIIFVVLFCMAWHGQELHGQNNEAFVNEAMAEKVYLQLDHDIYENNETIWFKAVLVNAATHKRDRTSSVLQVELMDASGRLLISKLVKINKGIGRGQISLNDNFAPGVYKLSANTIWNKNFKADFGFETYLQIYAALDQEKLRLPVERLTRTSTLSGTSTITMDLFPKAVDKFHEGKLSTVVSNGVSLDTLTLREKRGVFPLNFTISDTIKQARVTFLTKSGRSYTHNIALDQNVTSVQFFPESGKMVDGFRSKVGFKALGSDGKGKLISGKIINGDGQQLLQFKSDSLGMGHFVIPKVDSKKQYLAVLNVGGELTVAQHLPKAHASGTVLHVTEVDANIHLEIESSVYKSGTFLLEGICRGYKYLRKALPISDGRTEIIVPKNKFPEGPIAFKLLTTAGLPILERLFFNQRLDRRLQLTATGLNSVLATRDKQQFDIAVTTNAGDPVKANFSVLVCNTAERGDHNHRSANILSYLLLQSELKGKIESPSVYFDKHTHHHLDDLMLTQGWRNFKYTSAVRYNTLPMEKELSVSGVVNIRQSKKTKEQAELLLMTFDKNRTIYSAEMSVPGSFNVSLMDTYGDEIGVGLQVKGKRSFEDYALVLNSRKSLARDFNYTQLTMAKDSIIQSTIENLRKRKSEERKVLELAGVTVLEEVVLNGYNLTPKRKEMADLYGMPRFVIEDKELKDKEQSWSYGLFSVLESFFRDKISVRTNAAGDVIVRSITEQGRSGAPTLIVIDGVPVNVFEYPLLRNVRTDQIKSVEVIDNADNFGNLYRRVFPEARPPIPERGSVVAIYSIQGGGIFGTFGKTDSDLVPDQIQVFAIEKEFYVPPYDQEETYALKDFRSPVYWKPIAETNSNGNAHVNYYHSDNQGDFVIVIEALSETGQIGYRQLDYSAMSKD